MSKIIIDSLALAGDLSHDCLEKDWKPEVWGPIYHKETNTYTESAKLVYDIYYKHYLEIVNRNRFPGQIRD